MLYSRWKCSLNPKQLTILLHTNNAVSPNGYSAQSGGISDCSLKKMISLSDSIETLYAAFRDVPKPRKIDGCPCCIDDKNICKLLSKPLRKITGGELASYSSSAFLTVGEEADYLYFLPRILEIACIEAGWYPDTEVIGRAIGQAAPERWIEERREAFTNVLSAKMRELVEEAYGWTIDEWICAVAKMGLDIRPFLYQIEQSAEAVLAYYGCNSQALMKHKLGNAFWDRGDQGLEEVIAWFESPKIAQIILDGYGLAQNNSEQVAPSDGYEPSN